MRALSRSRREVVRVRLLGWYDIHARSLPWRSNPRDPYAVWISEVMLQQTRVATVIPYFERFMATFPDMGTLANAELDYVLGCWSGLGYYRRARALHAAARVVRDSLGGSLPGDLEGLQSLPGVGQYTAAAIASIAFGAPVAVVDGNVARVIARLTAFRSTTDTSAGRRWIQKVAGDLLSQDRPGAFNEAMMELGEACCTPRDPKCSGCPLRDLCAAYQRGLEADLPQTIGRPPKGRVKITAALFRCGTRHLFGHRKPEGLFGGLWEPLVFEGQPNRACRTWTRAHFGARPSKRLGEFEHTLTHRVLDVSVVEVRLDPGASAITPETLPPAYDRAVWLSTRQLAARGISSLARKVLASGTSGREAC